MKQNYKEFLDIQNHLFSFRRLRNGELIDTVKNLPSTYTKSEYLVMFDNIQFIYELTLALLEAISLGIEFEINEELKIIKILNLPDKELAKKRLAYFKSVCEELTDYYHITQRNVTKSVNQYLTHWIYPYKGKFHPQMVRALINIIGLKEGDLLLDPFSGSGTAAVEAQLLGVNFIGIDISPLCVIQGKVKTESIYVLDEIKRIRKDIIRNSCYQDIVLGRYIEKISDDERVRNFYTLARLVAVSDNYRRKKNLVDSFFRNLDLMIRSVEDYYTLVRELKINLGQVRINLGDSRNIQLPDESVDGIITSPPYSIALDYVENDKHSLMYMGYNLSKIREEFIGVRGKGKDKIHLYNEDMKKSYREMYRVLKKNRYAVIIIGNARFEGKEIPTVEFTIRCMESIGFKLERNINKNIFGLYNIMKNENILFFVKEK
ncbi:MAG: DNA methyltransferase [Spirochaetia bacterium]|nr:DNA methyltransferase [Spirochaetota bacterium]MDW8112337.1 DNA methyltransferase [Spirochaetia bacterium]